MKPVWFVLWAMVVAQIAVWTFAPPARHNEQPAPTDPGRPYGDNEQYAVDARDSLRNDTMAALEMLDQLRDYVGRVRREFGSRIAFTTFQDLVVPRRRGHGG